MIVHPVKCTKLLVLIVVTRLKYLLSQMVQDQSIAGIVFKTTGREGFREAIH